MRAILPADAGELQARRARDQIRLQGMQKMEAVGRLAGGIAHDFNNIVQAIGGYSELLQESLSAEDPRRETVDEILRAGDRAAALTRQLLAFSRQQVMQPRVLDLNEVVGTVESLLRRLIGEDVTLVARLSPELWSVRADPMQLEQVLMNLVVNARDAMPSGGSITIETDNASLDPVVRHRRLQRDARSLRAPVGDRHRPGHAARRARPRLRALLHHQGAGPRHRPRAVDGLRHRQADRRLHLDRLGAWGRAPASASTCRATRRRRCGWRSGRRRGPASTRGSETLLVVEDEEGVRELMQAWLESHGYRVLTAGNGVEALHTCEAFEGPIDLVVADMVMPAMGGPALARKLKPLRPGLKVMFMSGYADATPGDRDVLDEPTLFLQKPFALSVLVDKVREALDQPRVVR